MRNTLTTFILLLALAHCNRLSAQALPQSVINEVIIAIQNDSTYRAHLPQNPDSSIELSIQNTMISKEYISTNLIAFTADFLIKDYLLPLDLNSSKPFNRIADPKEAKKLYQKVADSLFAISEYYNRTPDETVDWGITTLDSMENKKLGDEILYQISFSRAVENKFIQCIVRSSIFRGDFLMYLFDYTSLESRKPVIYYSIGVP